MIRARTLLKNTEVVQCLCFSLQTGMLLMSSLHFIVALSLFIIAGMVGNVDGDLATVKGLFVFAGVYIGFLGACGLYATLKRNILFCNIFFYASIVNAVIYFIANCIALAYDPFSFLGFLYTTVMTTYYVFVVNSYRQDLLGNIGVTLVYKDITSTGTGNDVLRDGGDSQDNYLPASPAVGNASSGGGYGEYNYRV
jgi:hypothetical protein